MMMKKISLDDGLFNIETHIESEKNREKEDFKNNSLRLKVHYESIFKEFGSTSTLQELMLLKVQCMQIIASLKGANELYPNIFEYEVSLNQELLKVRELYIERFEELLKPIDETLKYRQFKENATSNPQYLLPLGTLYKIHQVFDGELWNQIDLNTFYALFDLSNCNKLDFKIKRKVNFYALLWKMYEVSEKPDTQEHYIKPLLERYGCKYSSFQNIYHVRITSKKTQAKNLMKLIENALK